MKPKSHKELDDHSADVLVLIQALELSFYKLKPYASEKVNKRVGRALNALQKDLYNHLGEHLKEVYQAKNN